MNSLFASVNTAPEKWQIAPKVPEHPTQGWVRQPVGDSLDLERILGLPCRPQVQLDGVQGEALAELMSARLRRDNPACLCAALGRPCITRLKPAQAWALYEAPLAGGLLGNIAVGAGKTIVDLLMPLVMPDCKQAVLLIPPSLKEQLFREYELLSQHFIVPSLILFPRGTICPGRPVLHVVPYSKLSREGATTLLEQLRPDLVIGDEAHRLKHRATSTTSRVLRYLANHPATRFCCWSGTLTTKSIGDYAHLSAFALKDGSPLPLAPDTVDTWATAIDPIDWPAPMGRLRLFCVPGETVQSGFHRRLVETRGVVATQAGSIGASIVIAERKAPEIPATLAQMLKRLRDKDAPGGWTRPDGEELVDILAVAACARQLACGFYYRWKFPKGEPEELIHAWFAARKAWHRELREKLMHRREHLDSPLLCAKAAIRGWAEPEYDGELPTWRAEAWPAWREIFDKVYHETEAVWVDDYLAQDAALWALKHRGIVWYEHDAFGRRVAELSGLPLHGGGIHAEEKIRAEKGDHSIIASIKAHGTGRDGLQFLFHDQLVANPPASAAAWEQLIGRLHREGQNADEVAASVYRHTPEMADAIDRAVRTAKYVESTMGSLQKLLAASCTW